jgi:iron complex outermembrane receptor protein
MRRLCTKLNLPLVFLVWTLPSAAYAQVLEEVVVTAQKREQSIQDVGVAISALTGDDIADMRMGRPMDIAAQIPGLDIKSTLGNNNPVVTIRGVGLNDFSANNSPSAGLYVDGVYITSPAMMGFQLFDLERVEVLKGPQGTLFGRNTTAGAVNFHSQKPKADQESYVTLGYGRYDTYRIEGGVGISLSDYVTGRVAVQIEQRDGGYYDNRFTGNGEYGNIDRIAWRAMLNWDVNDDVGVLLKLHGGTDKSDSQANWKARGIRCPEFDATGVSAPGCPDDLGYADPFFNEPHTGEWNFDPRLDVETIGVSAKVDWAISEDMSLTSLTAFQAFERFLEEDADGSPNSGFDIRYDNEVDQVSQEFLLTMDGWENVVWILGAFYAKDEIDSFPGHGIASFDAFGGDIVLNYTQETTASAIFSHVEYQLSDAWKLTAGLRFTQEDKDYDAVELFLDADGTNLFGPGNTPLDFGFGPVVASNLNFDDDNVSGKLGLDYTPNEDILIYASYSRGFKSGGFAGTAVLGADGFIPYESETLSAFEVGLKATLMGGSAKWNSAVFFYDYEDMQLFTLPPGGDFTRLDNAEEAEVKGFETEFEWLASDQLSLAFGLSTLSTENKDPGFSGLELPNSPELSYNGSASYHFPVAEGLESEISLNFNYVDETYKAVENHRRSLAEDYTLLNVRWSLVADKWEVALWGRNITDEEYVVEIFDQADLIGDYIVYFGAPSDYGLSFTYRW